MTGSYIIYSEKLNRFYIGATQEDISDRVRKHNLGSYGKQRFTSTTDDWKLILFIPANDYAHAIRMERKIKAMKSVKYIHNLITCPELLEKLIRST